MNMVVVTAYFNYLTVEFVTNATEVAMQFCFHGWMYQRLTVFGAEYDMDIVFNE